MCHHIFLTYFDLKAKAPYFNRFFWRLNQPIKAAGATFKFVSCFLHANDRVKYCN